MGKIKTFTFLARFLNGKKRGVQANLSKCREEGAELSRRRNTQVRKAAGLMPGDGGPPRPPPRLGAHPEGLRGSCGKRSPSRPPGLTILSRSSPLAWFMSLHVPLPGRGEEGGPEEPGVGGSLGSPGRGGGRVALAPSHRFFRSKEKKKKWKPEKSQGQASRGQGH